MSEEVKTKKKYGRHKPGWGRVFSDRCPYQDDAIYWKLYDLTILKNPRAVFEIKAPHRKKPNNNRGRKKNNGISDVEDRSREEIGTTTETFETPVQQEQENAQSH